MESTSNMGPRSSSMVKIRYEIVVSLRTTTPVGQVTFLVTVLTTPVEEVKFRFLVEVRESLRGLLESLYQEREKQLLQVVTTKTVP